MNLKQYIQWVAEAAATTELEEPTFDENALYYLDEHCDLYGEVESPEDLTPYKGPGSFVAINAMIHDPARFWDEED